MTIEQYSSGPTEVLQEVCREGILPHAQEVFEQDDVVMNQDGDLGYARSNSPQNAKCRERKRLVLGFNGYDQHSLMEANALLADVSGSTPAEVVCSVKSRLSR